MTKKIETEILTELIVAKCDVLQQLNILLHRQIEHIASGDMDALLHVLAAKDRLLVNLVSNQDSLRPFFSQIPEERVWRTKTGRRDCQKVTDKCNSLLGEIVELEKQANRDLIYRRDAAAEQLEGLHVASRAVRAYQQLPNSPVGRFTSDA